MLGNLALIPGRATTSGGDCPARIQCTTPPTKLGGSAGTVPDRSWIGLG
jgi:hypothetical protein